MLTNHLHLKQKLPSNSAACLHKAVQGDNYIKTSILFWHFSFKRRKYKDKKKPNISLVLKKKNSREHHQSPACVYLCSGKKCCVFRSRSLSLFNAVGSLLSHTSKINGVNEVKQCQIVKYLFSSDELHLPPRRCSQRLYCTLLNICDNILQAWSTCYSNSLTKVTSAGISQL